MKVYLPGSRGKHTVYVQPGKQYPASQFLNADGTATLFTVVFKDGAAEVSRSLGRYMIDEKIAHRSPIILSEHFNANRILTVV